MIRLNTDIALDNRPQMEREACPFTEGDVLVAPADCAAPGAQWRPALDTPEHPEYHSGQPDVPDISAKSRSAHLQLFHSREPLGAWRPGDAG